MRPPDGLIAIAGAGVAGLTAAIAFARAGFRVRVFERAERMEEVGAGLQLSPNATRILDRLGVLDALSPVAARPLAVDIRRAANLRRLAQVPLGEAALQRWNAPYLTAHRADLQSALLTVVARHEAIELVTGATVREVTFDGGHASLVVDVNGLAQKVPCLLAIGADGVWSTLWQAMAWAGAGQGRASRYTGYLAWRAMAPPAAALFPADRVTAWLHPGFHLVSYPVRAGAQVNLVAVTKAPAAAERWSNEGATTQLAAAMKGAAPALVDLAAAAGTWMTWPINEVPKHMPWTDPAGLALVGDAAHALSPYAAQGAAMAIEDAAVLVASVKRFPGDLPAALAAYEAQRRRRIGQVVARGAFNRFTWHASGPVAFARDLVLARRSPERLAADLDWLYGWEDPDTGRT